MSDDTHIAEPAEAPAQRSARRRGVLFRIGIGVATAVLLLVVALVAARYAVLTPPTRSFIVAQLDGLKAGRFGRIQAEGLEGDLFGAFSLRRFALADEKGVWLEAADVRINWRPSRLAARTVAVERLTAAQVRVLRRPVLGPRTPSRGLPVTVRIDDLRSRVEMLPEFSLRRGVYDVNAAVTLRRRSAGQRGRVFARSLLRAGDYLKADFDMGPRRPLLVDLDALEASGGALAGALGLPADQPFALSVNATGATAEGRFTAAATSGDTTPLQASGAWGEQGGEAQGRVSLTASTLTEGLARRLGDEVSFRAYGRKTQGALYALDGRLESANLVVVARGQGDVGKRRTGPAGVALSIRADQLSRLLGTEGFGAARIDGVIRGEADDLRFSGEGRVAQLALGGYALDRVQGPLRLQFRNETLTAEATLNGAGGRGSGYLAALLGASPSARIEAARLDNGRLLLRELTARGSGLDVKASGGRTLLGGLAFKGEATFANLEAARPGASGAVAAEWSANQGRAGQPWAFTLDATGRTLALGMAELDRLIGASPELRVRAALAGRRLEVAEARLNGANMTAQTAGRLNEEGVLDFDLDWTASGPFRAGPVEISGEAKGVGEITGGLRTPRAVLTSDFDQVDLPRLPLTDANLVLVFARAADGSSGEATLRAASDFGPARARTDFRFPQGGVDLTDLNVDAGGLKASGSVSLRRRQPSAADLDVVVAQGAFLDGGTVAGSVRIVDASGGPRADLDLTARNAVLPGGRAAIADGRLSADGPLSRLPYTLAATGASRAGRWSLTGGGVVATADRVTNVSFDGGGRLGRRELRTADPAVIRLGPDGERTASLKLVGPDGGTVDADLTLADSQADVEIVATGLDLGLLNEDLAGKINASLALQGRGERLAGALDARLAGARGRGADPATGLNGQLTAQLDDSILTIEAEGSNAQGLIAKADLVLPAESSAAPFRVALDRTKPVRGTFMADGEVRPLWDLLVGGERTLSGHVKASGTLGGTLADPRAVGEASVEGGRFTDGATGLALRDVELRAGFADNAVNVSQATATDGHGGRLSGGGRISLLRNGVSSFKLDLRDFRVIQNDLATADATGPVTIDRGADGKMKIAGELQVNSAEIAADPPTPSGVVVMEVVERNKPVDLDTSLAAPVRNGPGVALDVRMRASRGIFLRGRGLDVEFSLDARVTGTTSRPVLTGEARVVRGDYDFAGKRFEFDPRGVVHLSTSPRNIRLDLTATRSDTTLVAVVRILGTAARPEINLTSTPVLPNDEVLARVLFGTSASQLSPLEAAQLASALSALAGGGGFDVIGGLRNLAGLDRLALGGGGESAVSVSGGKYLTDDVYLELTGGGRDGASAQVEWRVRDSLAIISRIGGQGDAKLSVRWRRDY